MSTRHQPALLVGCAALTMAAAVAACALPARAEAGPAEAGPAEAGPAGAGAASIAVTRNVIADPVSPRLFGANERWVDGELGMWDPTTDAPNSTMVHLARRMGLGVVRYPGGTVANLFRWKRAIGPQAQRGCQIGGGFVGGQEPTDSTYGPAENGVFADAIGAETEVMTSSVQPVTDAADFVEYMNSAVGTNPNGGIAWADVRAANGHPAPYHVSTWEVGNELYLGNQSYWRADQDHLDTRLRQYAFGGTQVKTAERVGTDCDHRDAAAVSDGSPDQTFEVHWAPVDPSAPSTVMVDGTPWTRVTDLAPVAADARAYTLDNHSGAITFGNGSHGAIPPAGSVVTATYTSGPHPGFVDYYAAMKAVDPSINICTAWEKPDWVELMGREHPYDCIAPHLYAHPSKLSEPGGQPATAEAVYDAWQDPNNPATAYNTMHEVRDIEAELTTVFGPKRPGDDRPFLNVSEWGVIAASKTGPAPTGFMGNSVGRTLYGADMMGMMINNSVRYAVNSNLNGPGKTYGELFGGAKPDFMWQGRANLLQLYTRLIGSTPVRVNLAGVPAASTGSYAALTAYATLGAHGTVRVMVVNRDRVDGVRAKVHLPGAAGGRTVTVRTHNGPDIGSFNTPEDQGVIQTTTTTTATAHGAVDHTFAPHSVTLLEVRLGQGQ